MGLGVFGYNPRFPGQYADSETGLFHNYFRIYDQKGGRFTQSDPIGLRGGLNTYAYVGGNPVNLVDPLGLETTLITTVDYGIGSHSAVYIDIPGISPFLYDPAGSYEPKSGEQRGSGDVFEGNNASLKDYIDYQKSTTSDVNTTKIPTTPEQEKAIKDRAEKQGGAAPPFCSNSHYGANHLKW